MEGNLRFVAFIVVAFLAFVVILRIVLRSRNQRPPLRKVVATGLVVVVGGMLFAKVGQNGGLPWWIYYTVPMLVTVLTPPLAFRMNAREIAGYLVLSLLSSPLIHVAFSFFLGWKEYMPFIKVPSIWDM